MQERLDEDRAAVAGSSREGDEGDTARDLSPRHSVRYWSRKRYAEVRIVVGTHAPAEESKRHTGGPIPRLVGEVRDNARYEKHDDTEGVSFECRVVALKGLLVPVMRLIRIEGDGIQRRYAFEFFPTHLAEHYATETGSSWRLRSSHVDHCALVGRRSTARIPSRPKKLAEIHALFPHRHRNTPAGGADGVDRSAGAREMLGPKRAGDASQGRQVRREDARAANPRDPQQASLKTGGDSFRRKAALRSVEAIRRTLPRRLHYRPSKARAKRWPGRRNKLARALRKTSNT